MNIGIDGSRAFILQKTGTENYSYQIIKHIAKIDQKNNYLVYIRQDSDVSKDGWPKNFHFEVIKNFRLWTQIGLSKQTFKDQLDVLFIPAHTIPVIRKPGVKTVVTVHDLGSEYLPKTHQLKQWLYLSFMQKIQLKNATRIIAVSDSTKEDLAQRIGLDPAKIDVVYESFDDRLFKPVKGQKLIADLKKYGLKPQQYFIFVGTIQPRKNLKRIIEAYFMLLGVLPAQYPAVHPRSTSLAAATRREPSSPSPLAEPSSLVIIGKKGWMADEIYHLPKKLGIAEKVRFLDYAPDTDLPSLYSGAKALIFPSLFEGFGLPIIEAQACGCAVITSNISSMPDVAGKGAILVDPNSIDDIVGAMRQIEDKNLRTELIRKGFENIKRFSWEKAAAETLELLEKANKDYSPRPARGGTAEQ